jgi:hypothetical protein
MDDSGITEPSEFGARVTVQLQETLAKVIAAWLHEGRYDALVEGYRSGRYSLVLAHDGLTVIEATEAPPAGSPN